MVLVNFFLCTITHSLTTIQTFTVGANHTSTPSLSTQVVELDHFFTPVLTF